MKTYFRYGSTISSKALVEAISSPIGVGPFAGFAKASIDIQNSLITLKPGNDDNDPVPNELLRSCVIDRILARYLTKYTGGDNPNINFGCISRDGYICVSSDPTIEIPIQGSKGGLTEVLVFAKHTNVSEPIDNQVEFEAYWNQSTIEFFKLSKEASDPYYPTALDSRDILFSSNDPLTKQVSNTNNKRLYSYEYLLSLVSQAVGNFYVSETMVLVGIYGIGTNGMNQVQEPFSIVPYNSKWPTEIPYNETIHALIKASFKRLEDVLRGVDTSIADYMDERIAELNSSIKETLALSALPNGAIILWSGDTIPDGWEEVSAAQGKIIMGYLEGGITINGKQELMSIGSTYAPPSNRSYDFTIDSSNLPKHHHSIGIKQSDSEYVASGSIRLPMIQSYENKDTILNGKVGGDQNTSIGVQSGALVTSANLIEPRSYKTETTQESLRIEKLPPAITLKLIKKIS